MELITEQLKLDFKTNEYLEIISSEAEEDWRHYLVSSPFKFAIEKNYGGLGIDVSNNLEVLETASYHSIPLTLLYGINIALFYNPLLNMEIRQSKILPFQIS